MSLINDALKRIGQAKPPPPPSDTAPMQPAQTSTASSGFPDLVMPLAFVGIAAVGFWFVIKGIQMAGRNDPQPATVAAREITAPEQPAAPAPTPVAPAPAAEIDAANPAAASPALSPVPPTPATPPPPPPPTFPNLKLQAVFYRPGSAAVVINSQTLEVGQRIQDATIVSISRQSVRVQWRGEIRELLLP